MSYLYEYKGIPDSELLSQILYHYASGDWLTPKQKKALKRAIKRAAPVKVNAIFETQDGEVVGTTDAKVKRVEWQDDGSLTVVIDHWPQPAEPVKANDWLYDAMCATSHLDYESGAPHEVCQALRVLRDGKEKIMTNDSIKRYTVSGDIAYPIHEDPEGDYVSYEDHVAAIKADRKRRGHPSHTHCDNCGCTWLDDGLNPVGCPYCQRGEPDVAELLEALTELCDEIDKHEIHAAISETSISWFKRKARKVLAAAMEQQT